MSEIDSSDHGLSHRPCRGSPEANRLWRWRSPLRGPWLTSVLGAVLLGALPIVIGTGLLSYIAYAPQLGQAIPAEVGWLKLPTFDWPTRPVWLYRLSQGIHVGLGLVLIPVLLAKLWSVIPRLFTWPPARTIAQVLERISLTVLVGGALFETITGVLNIQYDYIFGFSFYTAHYFGAWVFIAGFLVHIIVKLPRMVTALRSTSMREVLGTNTADTQPESAEHDQLVAADPAPATMSRRGALTLVGGGAVLMAAISAGQTIGGITRHTALLLPRGRNLGNGPNDFQINKTAAGVGIDPASTGDSWRLLLRGGSAPVLLARTALTQMPQHTARLPISCVEGWSTTQTWSGVRLAELARLAGVPEPDSAGVTSLQPSRAFNHARLQANQIRDRDGLLALRVNGVDLSLDHGYPARIIVPALPGVHNTKWVASIDFQARRNA
jgi:DMSO/TMAO reductase YedYZ molybdopterin-dependent catalytic subunit